MFSLLCVDCAVAYNVYICYIDLILLVVYVTRLETRAKESNSYVYISRKWLLNEGYS